MEMEAPFDGLLACEVSYKGQTVWRESINKRSMNEEVVFLLQMWPLTLE